MSKPKATPHNSARKRSERFCAKSKFQKRGNTVCISRFWNCRIGAKDPLRSADAIVRCCPKIKITLVDRIGSCGCHRGHKIRESFDYDKERGKLCPMAMHVAFPYIDILRDGGTPPASSNGDIRFCCPDVDVINVFRLEVEQEMKC